MLLALNEAHPLQRPFGDFLHPIDGLRGYSANTRYQRRGYIVTSDAAEQAAVRQRRPLNDTRGISLDDKWANVARALSYQPVKDNAVALMERIGQARRGAVKVFHEILPPSAMKQICRPPQDRGLAIAAQRKQEVGLGQELRAAMRHVVDRVQEVAERTLERVRLVQREQHAPRMRM